MQDTQLPGAQPAGAAAPAPSWLLDFTLLALLWGSSFLFTRLAVADFGVVPSAGMRVLIGAVVLLLILAAKRQVPDLRRHWRKTFFIGLLNSALPFVAFAYAVAVISTGLTAILNATAPLFGAVIAWVWLKDRPGTSRAMGLALGFVGVVMLAWDKASFKPDAQGLSSGWALVGCLAGCVCYGIAASFTKRNLTQVPSLVTAAGSQCGATLALLAPMLWWWPARNPGPTAWAAMAVSGVLCTGMAYVLFFRLISRIGPAKAMTVTFLIPVFAILCGVVFLGEVVTLWMLVCALVIVCGTALSTGLVKLPLGE